jgi:hypothetical protein
MRDYEMITSENANKWLVWQCKKNFDDNISIQKILGFLKNICTKWDFSNKLHFLILNGHGSYAI